MILRAGRQKLWLVTVEWGTGAVDTVSALAVVNVLLVGVGLAVALRLGVRVHE